MYGVAAQGDRAVVTISYKDQANLVRGLIFGRVNGAWAQQAELTPVLPFGAGERVAIDGDVVVRTAGLSGVEVFRKQGDGQWLYEATLQGIPAPASIGASLAVNGTIVAAGAPSDQQVGIHAGAVHIFRRTGSSWQHVQKIVYPDGVAGGWFGLAMTFVEDRLAISATQSLQTNGARDGVVYIFRFDGSQWVVDDALTVEGESDRIGESLAYNNNVLCVGAPYAHPGDGAVYIFRQESAGSWIQEQKLSVPEAPRQGSIGLAVSIDGDVIVTGAYDHDKIENSSGAAHVFRRAAGQWHHAGKIWPPMIADYVEFGRQVAVSGEDVFISAPRENTDGGEGVVYLFEWRNVGPDDCNADGVPDVCQPNLDCNSNGVADICDTAVGFWDCNGDFVLDVCEIADGLDDCNSNQIVDWCEISSGLANDCNQNRVPDDCESPSEVDCNGNGETDFCEAFDYVLGEPDKWLLSDTAYEPADSLWLNHLVVQQGAETINSVALYVAGSQSVCHLTALVYDDPNNDGDPNDGVLLSHRQIDHCAKGTWHRIPVPPAYVGEAGDSFFVGATVTLALDSMPEFEQIFEYRSETVPGSWWGVGGAGEIDVDTLSGFSVRPLSPIGVGDESWPRGYWLIRADATHYEGVPEECMCPGNISSDGDSTGVDVYDLFEILNRFGDCPQPCAPFCAGDISSAVSPGLPDCAVDMHDVMAALERWGACE